MTKNTSLLHFSFVINDLIVFNNACNSLCSGRQNIVAVYISTHFRTRGPIREIRIRPRGRALYQIKIWKLSLILQFLDHFSHYDLKLPTSCWIPRSSRGMKVLEVLGRCAFCATSDRTAEGPGQGWPIGARKAHRLRTLAQLDCPGVTSGFPARRISARYRERTRSTRSVRVEIQRRRGVAQ